MNQCRKCHKNNAYRHLEKLCPRCYVKTKNLKSIVFELGTKENPIEVRCLICNELAVNFNAPTNGAHCNKHGYFPVPGYVAGKCYKRQDLYNKEDKIRIRIFRGSDDVTIEWTDV